MDGLRKHKEIVLWSGTGVPWGTFGNGGHNCLKNDNTIEVNSTTVGNTNGVGNVMFFDIPENIDYCWIEWSGSIASITTGGTPVGESAVRTGICALPQVSEKLLAQFPAMRTHPLESKAYPLGMADAWMADCVGGQSQLVSSTPPFFGMWFGENFSTNTWPAGWPFNGNAIVAGDKWSCQFPIGKLRDGSMLSVSGLRRIGLTLKSVNPAIVLGNPSAMTITAQLIAHLYEYRKRR